MYLGLFKLIYVGEISSLLWIVPSYISHEFSVLLFLLKIFFNNSMNITSFIYVLKNELIIFFISFLSFISKTLFPHLASESFILKYFSFKSNNIFSSWFSGYFLELITI